ncbi:MAG: TOBE domain-containing protein [Caldilineaceae bacterium]
MKISARNQLAGVVKSVKEGIVTAEVVIRLSSGEEVVSVITVDSVHNLDLKPGKAVKAIIKSTEILVATDD